MATTKDPGTSWAYHGTTDGSAHDDIKLDKPYLYVEVVNRDDTTLIAFALATGMADTFPTFTVGADGTVLLPPGAAYVFRDDPTGPQAVTKDGATYNPASRVQVLSSAPAAYSVYGRDA